MAMYQFLIAVRSSGPGGGAASVLMNEAGEVTSHIQGMFNRTIKLMSSGIKPVYVFDGKPPPLKGGELAKRLARRARAEADLEEAKDADEVGDMDKFSRRLVKVNRQHNEDCRELLRLMGVPVLLAPCEAEAQCAELARKGKVYATATEDMDALTFRTPKLIRRLTFSQSSKDPKPILEIDFEAVLRGLALTYDQFVDMCILCGCDYCSTIKGIGPKTALKLIKTHKSLERVLDALKHDRKVSVPPDWFPIKISKKEAAEESGEGAGGGDEDHDDEHVDEDDDVDLALGDEEAGTAEAFEEKILETKGEGGDEGEGDVPKEEMKFSVEEARDQVESQLKAAEQPMEIDDGECEMVDPLYKQARKLFIECEVLDADTVELKWTEPKEAELTTFLVDRMGFNAERVASGIKRLKEAQQQKAQKRMDR